MYIELANLFQALQNAWHPETVATIALLVSVPFQTIGQIIAFIGAYREEHIESNWFHRVFAFCDSTILGKLPLGLSVSSPVLIIFGAIIIALPSSLVTALSMALIPWILCPVFTIVELRVERKYPNSRERFNLGN
jgi:hypothetical protein